MLTEAQAGDRRALEALMTAHTSLLCALARRVALHTAMQEELVQAGYVGLLQAIQRWDVQVGTRLCTYALPWVLGEMRRCVRKATAMPEAARVRAHVLKTEAALRQSLGRAPRVEELASACGMRADALLMVMEQGQPPRSLEADVGCGRTLAETLPGESDIHTEHIDLRRALAALPDAQRGVILLRYFRGCTQRETAQRLGRSQAQISKLEGRALDALRTALQ